MCKPGFGLEYRPGFWSKSDRLLGNSILEEFQMTRMNDRMVLEKR